VFSQGPMDRSYGRSRPRLFGSCRCSWRPQPGEDESTAQNRHNARAAVSQPEHYFTIQSAISW